MSRRDRQRWREKQKIKREEALDKRTIAGALDLTPYEAVQRIIQERGCSCEINSRSEESAE